MLINCHMSQIKMRYHLEKVTIFRSILTEIVSIIDDKRSKNVSKKQIRVAFGII